MYYTFIVLLIVPTGDHESGKSRILTNLILSFVGIYKEIAPYFKIVSSADFKPMTKGFEIQTFLVEGGAKTKFTFNCVHPTEQNCRQQEEMGFYNGRGAEFDRLPAMLNPKAKYIPKFPFTEKYDVCLSRKSDAWFY